MYFCVSTYMEEYCTAIDLWGHTCLHFSMHVNTVNFIPTLHCGFDAIYYIKKSTE
jgi:hypothetical protein